MSGGSAPRRSLAGRLYRDGYLTAVLVAVGLVAGASALVNLPRIEDPRIATRNATVTTTLPGASARRVEAQVTEKIEAALEDVTEIKRVDSTSRAGVSVIGIELADAVDEDTNEAVFSKIRDRLGDVRPRLPTNASAPAFDDKRGAVAFTLITAITRDGDGTVPLGVLDRVAEGLSDRLRGVAGTEFTRLYGRPEEQFTVRIDATEASAIGLTISEVAGLIEAADSKGAAGILHHGERDLSVEITGELDGGERIANVVLTRTPDGAAIRVGDVADVRRGWREPPPAVAIADRDRAVFVAARMEADRRVDHWATAARAVIADYAAVVDPAVRIETVYDESGYTMDRLSGLGGNLVAGALVVVAVVLLFMGWRSALIVGAALPLSAAVTLFALTLLEQPLHQMTIFGMIVAIGLLIDNAVVMTDEVRRELRAGNGAVAAADAAVARLGAPLLASTLTTILGFMPILLLPGNVGDFVGPMAVAVVLALAASFVAAVTVIPALTARFARPGSLAGWWREGIAGAPLVRAYRVVLRASLRRPVVAMALVLALCAGGFGLGSTLPMAFFPPADRNQFQVELRLPGDASVARTTGIAKAVDGVIRAAPEVTRTIWMVGRSAPAVYYNLIEDQDRNAAYAQGIVTATTAAAAGRLMPRLQDALDARFPAAQLVIRAFGQGPPVDAPVGFRITGPDVDELRRLGQELRAVMHATPGVTHTRASIRGGEPKLRFRADEAAVRQAGLSLGDLAGQLRFALQGRTGGSVLEQLEELPVRVRAADARRSRLAAVSTLPVTGAATPSGEWIPLEALGTFELHPELAGVTRRDGERVNEVAGYVVRGALPIEVTAAIEQRLAETEFRLPPGYRLSVAGDSAEQSDALGKLATYLPVLVTLMAATLVLTFRSLALAAVIASAAGLSVGLGLLALWLGGYDLGFNPIIGSIGLVGVAVNGTIVVLASIRANPRAAAGDVEAIADEVVGTGRHILATTLTTMGGFVPLLVFTGGDFWPPLAVVIAGGIGFAVVLSMIFTPCAYRLLVRLGATGRAPREVSA